MTWSLADVETALPIVKGKLDHARAGGDDHRAAQHEHWINRLLAHREFLKRNRAVA